MSAMEKMFSSMLGLSPQELANTANGIIGAMHAVRDSLARIEANTQLLLESENERRRTEGRKPLSGVDGGASGTGHGTGSLNGADRNSG